MARNLRFVHAGSSWEAAITKLDRDKVYGWVEQVAADAQGRPCAVGNLLDDGSTLFLSGATALKVVDDTLCEVDKQTLRTVYHDGKDAVLVPSSYDGDVQLEPATLDDLFDLEVTAAYQLMWEDTAARDALVNVLAGGQLFRFIFNYRADYEGADALLLTAQGEVFVLTGRFLRFPYLENAPVVAQAAEDDAEGEDDMDFGML
jgi:hypothetical protein